MLSKEDTSCPTTSVTIIAILSCAALLFAGNGLFQTLLPIRGIQEGFSSALVGWLGTAYFGGFTIGCFLGPKIIMSVGHARTFAGITAVLTAIFLAFPLFVDLAFWIVLRIVSGACLAMLYIVVGSWLNDSASNANRGRTLSIYIIVSNCSIPDDHIDPRRSAFFMARSVFGDIREDVQC
jgi:MFS family permease